MTPDVAASLESRVQRLDKWLVVARFCKTRSVARALVETGRVRLDGRRILEPDRKLRVGDALTLALPHATLVVRVRDLGVRRGPAAARALYEPISPPADQGETP